MAENVKKGKFKKKAKQKKPPWMNFAFTKWK